MLPKVDDVQFIIPKSGSKSKEISRNLNLMAVKTIQVKTV